MTETQSSAIYHVTQAQKSPPATDIGFQFRTFFSEDFSMKEANERS